LKPLAATQTAWQTHTHNNISEEKTAADACAAVTIRRAASRLIVWGAKGVAALVAVGLRCWD